MHDYLAASEPLSIAMHVITIMLSKIYIFVIIGINNYIKYNNYFNSEDVLALRTTRVEVITLSVDYPVDGK